MDYWEGIIGCGLKHPEVSLAQLLDTIPAMDEVIRAILTAFQWIFDFDIQGEFPDQVKNLQPHS
jgi:hypothetical protein